MKLEISPAHAVDQKFTYKGGNYYRYIKRQKTIFFFINPLFKLFDLCNYARCKGLKFEVILLFFDKYSNQMVCNSKIALHPYKRPRRNFLYLMLCEIAL
jgi:hypothetical protein